MLPNETLEANQLPQIAGVIKDAINLGMWFLYRVNYKPNSDVRYSLSTTNGEYLLAEDGDIVSPLPKNCAGDIEYLSIVTFNGIPSAPVVNMPAFV